MSSTQAANELVKKHGYRASSLRGDWPFSPFLCPGFAEFLSSKAAGICPEIPASCLEHDTEHPRGSLRFRHSFLLLCTPRRPCYQRFGWLVALRPFRSAGLNVKGRNVYKISVELSRCVIRLAPETLILRLSCFSRSHPPPRGLPQNRRSRWHAGYPEEDEAQEKSDNEKKGGKELGGLANRWSRGKARGGSVRR